jgi:hypothetical protein
MKVRKYVGAIRSAHCHWRVLPNSCLEPFNADVPANKLNLLVVDGYINAGPGKNPHHIIKKYRPLSFSQNIDFETDAEVSIETETDESYLLSEIGVRSISVRRTKSSHG